MNEPNPRTDQQTEEAQIPGLVVYCPRKMPDILPQGFLIAFATSPDQIQDRIAALSSNPKCNGSVSILGEPDLV
jgi:hypothetical protein